MRIAAILTVLAALVVSNEGTSKQHSRTSVMDLFASLSHGVAGKVSEILFSEGTDGQAVGKDATAAVKGQKLKGIVNEFVQLCRETVAFADNNETSWLIPQSFKDSAGQVLGLALGSAESFEDQTAYRSTVEFMEYLGSEAERMLANGIRDRFVKTSVKKGLGTLSKSWKALEDRLDDLEGRKQFLREREAERKNDEERRNKILQELIEEEERAEKIPKVTKGKKKNAKKTERSSKPEERSSTTTTQVDEFEHEGTQDSAEQTPLVSGGMEVMQEDENPQSWETVERKPAVQRQAKPPKVENRFSERKPERSLAIDGGTNIRWNGPIRSILLKTTTITSTTTFPQATSTVSTTTTAMATTTATTTTITTTTTTTTTTATTTMITHVTTEAPTNVVPAVTLRRGNLFPKKQSRQTTPVLPIASSQSSEANQRPLSVEAKPFEPVVLPLIDPTTRFLCHLIHQSSFAFADIARVCDDVVRFSPDPHMQFAAVNTRNQIEYARQVIENLKLSSNNLVNLVNQITTLPPY
jgi:hypothetical protein